MKDINKQSVLIGAKFKQLRQARGYTQGRVADVLGVSSQHYGTLERGINAYSLDNILKLCDFYNVSVMSILGEIRKNDRRRKHENQKLASQIEELEEEHKEVVSHMVKFYRQLERRVEKEAKEKQLGEIEKNVQEIEQNAIQDKANFINNEKISKNAIKKTFEENEKETQKEENEKPLKKSKKR